MNDDQLTEEERLALEQEEEPKPETGPLPTYITAEQHQAMLEANNAALLEQIKGLIPAAPVPVTQVNTEDTRDPWLIAEERAAAVGREFDDAYKSRIYSDIQAERIRKDSASQLEKLTNTLGGLLLPVVADRTVTQMAGGDQALAVEINKVLALGGLDASALNTDFAKTLVLTQAKANLAEAGKTAQPFPGAAPASTGQVLNGNSSLARNRLNPEQKAALKIMEEKYGKYDDAMVKEEFGI